MKTALMHLQKPGRKRKSTTFLNYNIMVGVGMLWLILFNIVPMIGIVMAFENYDPVKGFFRSDFIGLENFQYLFSMSDSRRVIVNTIIIAVSKLVLNVIVPLVFALLLNEIRKMKFICPISFHGLSLRVFFWSCSASGGLLIR